MNYTYIKNYMLMMSNLLLLIEALFKQTNSNLILPISILNLIEKYSKSIYLIDENKKSPPTGYYEIFNFNGEILISDENSISFKKRDFINKTNFKNTNFELSYVCDSIGGYMIYNKNEDCIEYDIKSKSLIMNEEFDEDDDEDNTIYIKEKIQIQRFELKLIKTNTRFDSRLYGCILFNIYNNNNNNYNNIFSNGGQIMFIRYMGVNKMRKFEQSSCMGVKKWNKLNPHTKGTHHDIKEDINELKLKLCKF